jgi:hypothetical protein
METNRIITGVVLLSVLAGAPSLAEAQRRRGNDSAESRGERGEVTGRAVPRSRGASSGEARAAQEQRAEAARQNLAAQQAQAQRQYRAEQQVRAERQVQAQRQYRAQRQWDARRDYDNRRDYRQPYYPSYRGYNSRTVIVPRYITPRVVTVVPYRPYVYRPSIGYGLYYGAGGQYPYGYTPRGYYDPIPGRAYGGLRITGASRAAQVFADGYYVGIVNDFDGIFQHLNLEAGPHQIEIHEPGFQPIAFDVVIQPGRTITFRAED